MSVDTMAATDEALEMAAKRLEARATTEQLTAERGVLTRDGSTARRLYAADVLREEADWIRRCKNNS